MKHSTECTYAHDYYLQHLLEYVHFQNLILVLTNRDSDAEYLFVKQNNHILLPKLDDNLNYLLNANSLDNSTCNKTKT